MRFASLLPLAALATACATSAPLGPSVMVLPDRNASFDRFEADDANCRGWADHEVGIAPRTAAQQSVAEGAVVGTAIGAAAGAAIGAASGQPATGAAIGAGSGLLAGSLFGGSQAGWSHADAQQRYDAAYMQCMYGHGHQIPVAAGSVPYSNRSADRSYDDDRDANIPPPPRRGAPPPPPPDLR